jgi:hypothetical protein
MSVPPIERPNVIAALTDTELFDVQLAVALACGRSRSALAPQHRRQHYCFLFETLKLESDYRGVPAPTSPYRPGDFSSTPSTA